MNGAPFTFLISIVMSSRIDPSGGAVLNRPLLLVPSVCASVLDGRRYEVDATASANVL